MAKVGALGLGMLVAGILVLAGCEQKRPEGGAGEKSLAAERQEGRGGLPASDPAAARGAVDATPEVGVPADAAAAFQKAQDLKRAGDVAAAIENYKRAIELHPDFPTAYRMLGYAYFQTNQLDAAIAAYEKAVELSPDYVDAHNGLAMLYFQTGQLDKAAAHQEKVKALVAGASGHSVEGMLPPGHPPMGATPGATERRSELPEGHPPIR